MKVKLTKQVRDNLYFRYLSIIAVFIVKLVFHCTSYGTGDIFSFFELPKRYWFAQITGVSTIEPKRFMWVLKWKPRVRSNTWLSMQQALRSMVSASGKLKSMVRMINAECSPNCISQWKQDHEIIATQQSELNEPLHLSLKKREQHLANEVIQLT